jgi:predicted acetyltransferase
LVARKSGMVACVKLELRTLRIQDEEAFRRAVREFGESDPGWDFAFHYDAAGCFADYVALLDRWAKGEDLPAGFVPHTYLVGVVGTAIVGRVSLRHRLNDFLERIGGHVGYGVVPSERRKGYASEMFKRTLPIAAALGIRRLLVTCDEDNLASRRIIEKHGGVFDGFAEEVGRPLPKRRYWVVLNTSVFDP